MISFQKGDRVIIQLKSNDVYEGDIEFCNEQLLKLSNIDYENTRLDLNSLCFYQEEIGTIYQLTNKFPYLYDIFEGIYDKSTNIVRLPKDELQRIKGVIKEPIYITRTDNEYYRAIDELNFSECIGVIGLGHKLDRVKGFSFLVMSTFDRIFIFDLLELIQLRQLKEILISDSITKIVHNSKILYDCLYHKYNVEMKNIFDTQIADSMSSQQGRNIKRSLAQCLKYRLNLPLPFDDDIVNLHDSKWDNRPLKIEDKTLICSLVAFLIPLKDYLAGILLQNLHKTIKTEYKRD